MSSKIRSCFVATFALFLLAAGPMMAQHLADVSTDASGIYFIAKSQHAGYQLTVGGPDGEITKQTFTGGETPAYQLDGAAADGTYTWELKAMAAPRDRATDQPAPRAAAVQTGAFTVAGGGIVGNFEESQAAAASPAGPLGKAQVFATDLIVQGSSCIGFDCTSSESFGFDTLRLKENNLRIKFQDTSASASFPSNDWQITVNDSSNGGANKFSIDDIDGGRTPFTIEAGAPSNTLYAENDGDVGIGTANPAVRMHIVKGDSPTLRLEQDGSSGFTPQSWDVAGNETNFFIRDVTNGSKLPFRIKPNAPKNSIFINAGGGDIGMGNEAPTDSLHISRSDGTAGITVEDTNGTNSSRTLLTLENNGTTNINLIDNNTNNNWLISGGTAFTMSQGGTGGAEIEITDNTGTGSGQVKVRFRNGSTNTLAELTNDGDLNLLGSVGMLSDRNAKTKIIAVDPSEVLDRVLALPVATWAYKHKDNTIHMGPMAQDFYAAFGLSDADNRISLGDMSGVALAAIQGLSAEVDEKERPSTRSRPRTTSSPSASPPSSRWSKPSPTPTDHPPRGPARLDRPSATLSQPGPSWPGLLRSA